ncbi:AAA family ATPase [Kamptonema sp. UHCC 0994]|uniref:McrB family protein n=1 Tax=Kamptonema sp. UHCC 0994 TaxID=3031329 RepID=UPI0023BA8DD1|nr:AAA family ATPase [Kamptonema sp. UHCC 0994]MDF0556706.1 AAA family ATPase [Kamptonema sp. UHCC 0994]
MEKLFVHPECPFSVNTFDLLAEFEENPTSDFYVAHKKDFLNYVEKPVKYILSQVEEQLPDFIKKYINIKHEKFGSIIKTKYSESTAYSVAFCFEDINSIDDGQLRLSFHNQNLTFSVYAKLDFIIRNYQDNYIDNENAIAYLKCYRLPAKYDLWVSGVNTELGVGGDENWSSSEETPKNIYELLVEKDSENYSLPLNVIPAVYYYINVGLSLKLKETLGSSAKQLVHKIVQAFKKLFPLFLIANFYDTIDENGSDDFLIGQYFSVYEKEFNPVYQLEEISEITGFQTKQLNQWKHAINRKGQTIIQGPPGTGKTFIAERLAKHLIGGGDGFSDIIQFHPAYTYEDFIEGLRPITENGQLTYSIVPGRFLQFCEKAEGCEDTCVLIIDEINRANLSQVFGELMYLLDDRQDTERFITLASGKLFKIPTNVRIIGTMNTADRSIALVDNALRRRFAFIPISPNYELLQNYHNREETDFPVDKLIGLLKEVNQAINNKHYELGISFFLTETLAEDIQDIWQMEIEPYLEEYFFDNQKKMDEFLWDKIKDKLSK